MKRAAAIGWMVTAGMVAIAAAFTVPAIAQATQRPAPVSTQAQPAAPAAVQLTVTVTPSRLIVIDEAERIVEIYSNTRTAAEGTYALHIREGGQQGPEVQMTAKVQAEYAALLGKIDWTRTGKVYGQ